MKDDRIDSYDLAIAEARGFIEFDGNHIAESPYVKGSPMRKMYNKGYRKAERMLMEMGRKAFRDGKGKKRDTQCSSKNAQEAFKKGWKMEKNAKPEQEKIPNNMKFVLDTGLRDSLESHYSEKKRT